MEPWKDGGRAAEAGKLKLPGPEMMFDIDPRLLQLKNRISSEEAGLGEVWVGVLKEPSGSHEVAVKRYPSAWMEQELTMFQRETAVLFMAAMRCHNVCKVYGTSVKDEKMCIVMKLYKESLAGLLRRSQSGKLRLEQVRRLGGEICKAVAELHEQNIILQDLKPPNILLDDFDHCVVADFGISKIVQGNIGVHMPSNVQGTFNYMSPEAFDPEQFGGISNKADSWSFACTLLEMMTGIKPWQGHKMAPIVRKVMNGEVPDIPPGLPPRIEQMLRRCFCFNPRDRPSFQEMYEHFKAPWEATPDPKSPQAPLGGDILAGFDVFGVFGGQRAGGQGAARPGSVDGDAGLGAVYRKAQEAEEAKQEMAGLKVALMEQKSTLERVQQRLEEKTAECERTASLLESKDGTAEEEARREREGARKEREEREAEAVALRERLAVAAEERHRERVEREALVAEKELLGRERDDAERSRVALEVEVEELRRTIQERMENREAEEEEERGLVEQLRKEKERLEREQGALEAAREAAEQGRRGAEGDKAQALAKAARLEAEEQEREAELTELRGELAGVYADKNNWKAESRALQASKRECESLQKRLADLTEQSARLSDVMEKSSKELRKLYGEREQWKKESAAHDASQEGLKKQVGEKEEQIGRLGAELQRMETARVKGDEEHVAERQRMQVDVERQRKDLEGKVEDLEAALESARRSTESSAHDAGQQKLLEKRLHNAEEQNGRLGAELQQMEAARKALLEEGRRGQAEVEARAAEAEARVEELEKRVSQAEEEGTRLRAERKQAEAARLVLLEEFEAEKQKLEGDFERRQLALERKVQELEVNKWSKRDLWSSADEKNGEHVRRMDQPSSIAADFSSPPIAHGGVADGQARVVSGPVEHSGHREAPAPEEPEVYMSKQEAEELLRIASRVQHDGQARIAQALYKMAHRSQRGQSEGAEDASQPPRARLSRSHGGPEEAWLTAEDAAAAPASPAAPPRSTTYIKFKSPHPSEQSARPHPVPSPNLAPSASPAARNPPTPSHPNPPPPFAPATPARSFPAHLALEPREEDSPSLPKAPSSGSELSSPAGTPSNRLSTGQPRVLAISRARAGSEQREEGAEGGKGPQPPPRLTVVPKGEGTAGGGAHGAEGGGLRASFEERVLSLATSRAQQPERRAAEEGQAWEPVGARANVSPARDRRGGLGLMLEGDRITKIIAGSRCHKAGLKVGDVVRKVNGELVQKAEVSSKLRKGLREAGGGWMHVGVVREKSEGGGGPGQLWDFTIEVEEQREQGRSEEPVPGLIGHNFMPPDDEDRSPTPRFSASFTNGSSGTPRAHAPAQVAAAGG